MKKWKVPKQPDKIHRGYYLGLTESRTPERKKHFVALYGVFCITPTRAVHGYTEHSFSMGWSEKFVRGWDYKYACYYLNHLIKDRNHKTKEGKYSHPQGRYFIYRLTRKSLSGMIVADFKTRNEAVLKNDKSYDFRNIPFKVRHAFK